MFNLILFLALSLAPQWRSRPVGPAHHVNPIIRPIGGPVRHTGGLLSK